MATTVYDFDLSAGTIDAGWQGYTTVSVIAAAGLGAATGNQIKVSIFLRSFGVSQTISGYVGQMASSGDVYDFSGTQVQLLWSGSATQTGNGSADQIYVSDWITLGEAYDNTKSYGVALAFSAGASIDARYRDQTNSYTYYKAGSDAATTNKTGYTVNVDTSTAELITKLEIQAAASGGAVPTYMHRTQQMLN